MKAFRHCVSEEVSLSILNTIYAVFLGLLSTYFFAQRFSTDGVLIRVVILVDHHNRAWVALATVYFFLDWLTTNITVSIRGKVNHVVLIALVVLISYLGGIVIMAFAPGHHFLVLLSLYAVIVPVWDFLVPKKELGQAGAIAATIIVHGLIAVRWCVGLMLAASAFFVLRYKPDDFDAASPFFMWLLVAFVLLKLLRYLVYAQLAQEAS